ncbi:alpha/beta fold hydrolase [Acidisphaera sp. L21]|uniref:alpha/beta fold hydrolase n=1 Tax=Acidisphaera sp. L21 TaxID=1641851 RepID=UPI00131D4FF3|nr:alpha/beta hydrolase [Acidisphaera sp. L21]
MTAPALPPRRTGTLERPGCTLYYEVTGSGPAIVFAHGLGGNHLSWWQQVAHFAPRFTCITIAHRGFYPSSPVAGGPDPADFAADLAALAAHLDVGADLRIVAQSMGGWTAVEYALQRPAGLKGVVLAATTGSIDPKRLPASDHPALAAWTDHARQVRTEILRRFIHPAAGIRMAEEQPAMHLLYRHIDDMNAGLDKEALRARMMAARVRAPEELAGVPCPILMIGNAEDTVMPPMAAAAIARVAPNVQAAWIDQAGHSAYFERAVVFNQVVEEFLAKLA